MDNYFIYCNHILLNRRVSKVYHFKENGEPFIYDFGGDPISLSELNADYMVLNNFKPEKHKRR